MVSLINKIKRFLHDCQGEIIPDALASDWGVNVETVKTYLRKLHKKYHYEKVKDGRSVKYIRVEEPKVTKEETQLTAHDLHVHVVLDYDLHRGCLSHITSLKNPRQKVEMALQELLGFNACISKYNAQPKKRESTTIHGSWFWESTRYWQENLERKTKGQDPIGRKIYFKLSWGKETIKEKGGPTLYLTCGCTFDPLDRDGILWWEHEIRSSFGIDLPNHPNAFALCGGIGLDLEKEALYRDNRINMRYHLYKDVYLEHYDKEFPDGKVKERITPHFSSEVAKYQHVANIVKNARETPIVVENQRKILKAQNNMINSTNHLTETITRLLTGIDAILMKLNVIVEDMPADYLQQQKQQKAHRIDREYEKYKSNPNLYR